MLSANPLDKRRQLAGVCLALGLVVEALCLIWATPIAFVIFVALGGLLMFVGIVLYLSSLVVPVTPHEK
jgi:predicted membrane channel-forming protein YqfA (hemolysin III family)